MSLQEELQELLNIHRNNEQGCNPDCMCYVVYDFLSRHQESGLTMRAADGGESGHDLDTSSATYQRLIELREKSRRR